VHAQLGGGANSCSAFPRAFIAQDQDADLSKCTLWYFFAPDCGKPAALGWSRGLLAGGRSSRAMEGSVWFSHAGVFRPQIKNVFLF